MIEKEFLIVKTKDIFKILLVSSYCWKYSALYKTIKKISFVQSIFAVFSKRRRQKPRGQKPQRAKEPSISQNLFLTKFVYTKEI